MTDKTREMVVVDEMVEMPKEVWEALDRLHPVTIVMAGTESPVIQCPKTADMFRSRTEDLGGSTER